MALRVARFSGADEEVEREVVHPAGEQSRRIREQQRDSGQRAKAPFAAAEVLRDEHQVDHRDGQGNRDQGDEVRLALPREDDQEHPGSARVLHAEKIDSSMSAL